MPNSKNNNNRKGNEEKNRRGKLSEKPSFFHGWNQDTVAVPQLIRPKTAPDLLLGKKNLAFNLSPEIRPLRLTKLLLNVTLRGSVGAVMVVMLPEATVKDLIDAVVRQYVKEGRRPIIPTVGPDGFDLHYSQFSLENLDREEKLMDLGSRNFYLCPAKSTQADSGGSGGDDSLSASTCSKEVEKANKIALHWSKFMDFLLQLVTISLFYPYMPN